MTGEFMVRVHRVKDKNPSKIQITAEQIIREARDRHCEKEVGHLKQKIIDQTELDDYRLGRRKGFENLLRIRKGNSSVWVKYAHWEESQKDFARSRSIWERALQLGEGDVSYRNSNLWRQYAEFEMKNGFPNHARNVWERAVTLLPGVPQLWYKYIHMEDTLGNVERARQVFERFVKWHPEAGQPKTNNGGVVAGAEFDDDEAIVCKRRLQYEEEVRKNPLNYDAWFSLARLEESLNGNKEMIREVYERAIANTPPAEEKRYWQRYIYLWVNYALFEELDAEDMQRTREVYRQCLACIPHHKFSFSKIWLMAAQFEIRQKNLQAARRLMGNSIGRAPSHKIFRKYIEMELTLGNMDRCRTLYQKYLEWAPQKCCVWIKFAELESFLCEIERARAIFELAITQPTLDTPELLWKAYIDFEMSQGECERTRQIYNRLVDRTKNLNVWISYAHFEAGAAIVGNEMLKENDEASLLERRKLCIHRARKVFETAVNYFSTSAPELNEEMTFILDEWLKTERSVGVIGDVSLVENFMSQKLKRSSTLNLQFLEAAYRWKRQKLRHART